MNKGNRIRVLLAEDHDLVRLGVRTLLLEDQELDLVGEAVSFAETLALAKRLVPDVLLLDLTLTEGLIIERIPELLQHVRALKILVLTADPNKETHRLVLQLGAVGIFTKGVPSTLLPKAIRNVYGGEIWIDRHTASAFVSHFQSLNKLPSSGDSDKHRLTPRERQIAVLAAQGLPCKKIAGRINISDKTVRNQLVIIYSKLGVKGQLELALKAQYLDLL